INKKNVGNLGLIKNTIIQNFEISDLVYAAELNLKDIIENSKLLPEYKKITQYAVIKLDLTTKESSYESFKEKAFSASKHLIDVKLESKYKDNTTFRLFFSSFEKNLTEKEAKEELEKIKNALMN
ncbi:MAG: hypothetical protein WEC80_00090, partial [Patescibacteria group bacterium]